MKKYSQITIKLSNNKSKTEQSINKVRRLRKETAKIKNKNPRINWMKEIGKTQWVTMVLIQYLKNGSDRYSAEREMRPVLEKLIPSVKNLTKKQLADKLFFQLNKVEALDSYSDRVGHGDFSGVFANTIQGMENFKYRFSKNYNLEKDVY